MIPRLAFALSHYPYGIASFVLITSLTAIITSLVTHDFPDFSDPQLGFQTRLTKIASRETSWQNLQDSTSSYGPLTNNPGIGKVVKVPPKKLPETLYRKTKVTKPTENGDVYGGIINHEETSPDSAYPKKTANLTKWQRLLQLKARPQINWPGDELRSLNSHLQACGVPNDQYSRLVVTSKYDSSANLFTRENLLSICQIERKIQQLQPFKEVCELASPMNCCPSWSVPNYVARLNDRSSCMQIMDEDLEATMHLLQMCKPYYQNHSLRGDCIDRHKCDVPRACTKYNAVYTILHYLADNTWLNEKDDKPIHLKFSIVFLPIAASIAALPVYNTMNLESLSINNVEVVSLNFGVKVVLFDQLVVHDTILILIGASMIVLIVFLYTDSVLITVATMFNMLIPLGITYFLYTTVFGITFFPFMNILATVVTIDIGADNAFIFYNMWRIAKTEGPTASPRKVLEETLVHTLLSMFVASVTTAAAFFASFCSDITAIRCFGIFAGLTILVNFVLMVSWFPACIVLTDRWFEACPIFCRRQRTQLRKFLEHVGMRYEAIIVYLVLKLRWFWVILLFSIAMGSTYVVFCNPTFKLPTEHNSQLFRSSNPMERYDAIHKFFFDFEVGRNSDNAGREYRMPLRFVWGVKPVDNGDSLNPHSRGSLVYDRTFDISAPESQVWLHNFCKDLRKQKFYHAASGLFLSNCFIDQFAIWMRRKCFDRIENVDVTPCCQSSSFPFRREIFDRCIVDFASELAATPPQYMNSNTAGLKFSRGVNATIMALIVEYESSISYNARLDEIAAFYNDVENWMQRHLATAPDGMKTGWFTSDLQFFDLQISLAHNTLLTVGISMAISLFVFFLVTLDVVVSIFAFITIMCSIVTTMALLVLLNWDLDVVESIAVTSSIGLAVDFSLHYSVHYTMCTVKNNRTAATVFALARMVGPATIVALTTIIAGCIMIPSSVIAYTKIGIFLVVIMLVSLIYSTFFLTSLLAIAGPENGFGVFQYSTIFSWCFPKRTSTRPAESSTQGSSRKASVLDISTIEYPMQGPEYDEHTVMLDDTVDEMIPPNILQLHHASTSRSSLQSYICRDSNDRDGSPVSEISTLPIDSQETGV